MKWHVLGEEKLANSFVPKLRHFVWVACLTLNAQNKRTTSFAFATFEWEAIYFNGHFGLPAFEITFSRSKIQLLHC